MRIGGVSVGKVKSIELAPPDKRVDGHDTTEAEIEIEPQFAPISTDARAILRQKTLLGETYVELTSGTEPGTTAAPVSLGARRQQHRRRDRRTSKSIPEGGTLGHRPDPERDPDRRDLQRARPRDPHRLPALAAESRRSRSTAAASTSTTRSATSARSSPTPPTSSASCASRRWQLQGPGPRHRHRLRRAQRARPAARRRDHRLRPDLRRARRPRTRRSQDSFQILPTFQRETRATLDRLDQFQANTRAAGPASCCRSPTTSARRCAASASSRRT